MRWIDQLRRGSFRGVPFYTEAHSLAAGRRVARHEFPGSDIQEVDDLGGVGHAYTIDAYVVGDDYMQARDVLREALDRAGPGVLVHHYLGELRVQAGGYTVTESRDSGGWARFSVQFFRADERAASPSSSADGPSLVEAAGEAAKAGTVARWTDLPVNASERIEVQTRGFLERVRAFDFVGATEEVAAHVADLDQILATLEREARNPGGLSVRLQLAIDKSAKLSASAADRFRSMFGFADDSDRSEGGVAVSSLIRVSSTAGQAGAITTQEWASYDDAVAARAEVVGMIDSLAADVSDAEFAAMQDVRAQLFETVPGEAGDLPRIQRLQLSKTETAAAVSYRLYRSVDREPEIVSRNEIRHPGFISGARELEVLIDV